ncbi:MAG: site-2 protease family protein [Puniceicoccaceae bacterium]
MQIPIEEGIILYLILLCSLSIHEWAHAWTAQKLGDDTARLLGRVTLNPIAHMDLFGTLVFPLLMIFGGVPLIGWGKPVPVNVRNLRQPVRDHILVVIAGPLSNLVLLLATCLIVGLYLRFLGDGAVSEIPMPLMAILQINVILTLFNLIPIPPLDGSHLLRYAIGMTHETFMKFSQWGFVVLMVLLFLTPFGVLFRDVINWGLISSLRFIGLIAGIS